MKRCQKIVSYSIAIGFVIIIVLSICGIILMGYSTFLPLLELAPNQYEGLILAPIRHKLLLYAFQWERRPQITLLQNQIYNQQERDTVMLQVTSLECNLEIIIWCLLIKMEVLQTSNLRHEHRLTLCF